MPSDNEPSEYRVSLPSEQAEQIERAAASRAHLDTVNGADIIREAVAEYLTRQGRFNTGRDGRPDRVAVLFEYLFGGDEAQAFQRLSEGIDAILDNAATLLDEAGLLAEAKRYERAEFLIATAQEEMGKAYILLDMCRVDLARRQDVLRRLCRAFYSHILKHVYFDLSAHDYPGIWELPQVQHYFRVMAQEWWPGSIEDGEPDMPHDTFFLREANLYVDVDPYARKWMVPPLPAKLMMFEAVFMGSPLDHARAALQKLRATQERGLFRGDALQTFNRRMKSLSVSERTPTDDLRALYQLAGEDLETAIGVPLSAFKESELQHWPMYWVTR